MAQSPKYKVHKPGGEYIASCKYAEDAAALASIWGPGAKIKDRDAGVVVWVEGSEALSAGESYDAAAKLMHERAYDAKRKAMVRVYGEAKVREMEASHNG